MMAIAAACDDGRIDAKISVVAAPKSGLPLAGRASAAGLNLVVVPYVPESTYGLRLAEALEGCDLICLAGYTRLLPDEVLGAFPERILNIHPGLLPRFGGQGMFGLRVHAEVLAAGVTESGCSVHLVNERYDDGRVLVEKRVPVLPGDTPESLGERVLEQEHLAYVEAIQLALRN